MPGGGGGGQTVNTNQFSSFNNTTDMGPWKTQIPYLGQAFGEASRLYGQGAPQYYPTSTVAPNNWAQSGGFLQAQDFGKSGVGERLASAGNDTALKTIQGGFLDPSSNPWLSKTFAAGADDVTRAYQTATSPTTGANFSGLGRYGSPSYRLTKESNERSLGSTLNNLATSIYGGNYQQERDRMDRGTANVGNQIGTNFMLPSMLMGIGGQKQGLDQAVLGDDVNRWNFNQMGDWQNLMRYKSLIDGNYGQSGTQSGSSQSYGTQTQPGGGGNPFAQGLGGLLSLGSLAGQLGWAPFASGAAAATPTMLAGGGAGSMAALPFLAMSDVRAKEAIAPVGKTFDGQNLYAYRYKGDATPHVGLMAQEVEQRDPGAVIEGADGFKRVDYARALHGAGWRPFG